jgi:rhodanese-related sulfurtransferase
MSMRRVLPRLAVALLIATAGAWAAVHRDETNLATLDASLDSPGLWATIGYMILLALGLFAAVGVLPRLLRRMRDPVVWIEPIELKRRLDDREAIIVVDVRGPEEFSGVLGHIPEARNLPMPNLADRLSELKRLKGDPLVLVCLTDKRSAKAAALMRTAGFQNINVLRGGMKQWNESKLPVAYQRSNDAPNLS